MSIELVSAPTLAAGIAIAFLGAVAYWWTLSAVGLLAGAFVGGALGGVIIDLMGESTSLGLLVLVLLAVLGGWIGFQLARKANAFVFGLLGSTLGGALAYLIVTEHPEAVPLGSPKYIVTILASSVIGGFVAALFQKQIVMIVAAIAGAVLIVAAFDPMPPGWMLPILVVASLVAQSTLIVLFKRKKPAVSEE